MKKIIISILLILLCGCSNKTDSIKFKEEYESLNGVLKQDGNTYINMNIDSNNPIKYATYDEIIEILDSTGVIYLGFKECPWCRTALPILFEAAKEMNVKTIYYYNALPIRDIKELKDGRIITTKEGTKEYYDLVNKLSSHLGVYKGLNDETIKRIYFPTIVFVKDGNIEGVHVGTLSAQTDINVLLTNEQKQELKEIYKNYMSKITNNYCDGGC